MQVTLAAFGILLQILATHALIVPDEVPSLLSVIYSNIPTIKKGTDSRFGWGFRLGNRADFQVLVELGPQLNTQPIRQIPSGSSKRNVQNNLRNVLYAQQQRNKQIPNTEGGKWINQWSQNIQNSQENVAEPSDKPLLGVGEIDAKAVIPDDATLMLRELYKKNVVKKNEDVNMDASTTTQKSKTTTSANDALDNVDIDNEK